MKRCPGCASLTLSYLVCLVYLVCRVWGSASSACLLPPLEGFEGVKSTCGEVCCERLRSAALGAAPCGNAKHAYADNLLMHSMFRRV